MTSDEVAKMHVGDVVTILVGPYKGANGAVLKVELDAGASNGWVTVVVDPFGKQCMYAGEEIAK